MIGGGTRVAGIIGWPVAHSLSPAMHNAAFRALRLDWIYAAFPVEPARVEEAVHGLAAAGCAGLNVTIPHKRAAIAACSSVSEAVTAIGAANTLVPDGAGGFRGDNTDAAGFLRALDEQAPLDLAGADVLLIGAGGAARAVAFALRGRGARVRVANRTAAAAAELGDPVPFTGPALDTVAGQSALVVNATSLGLHGDDVPAELPMAGIGRGQVVADIVYRPGGTPWLAAAAGRGARTVDGLGMLLHQGAAAFEQWTGQSPPVEVMREALAAR
ncbi:shikimate dehydrogenase [Miltoncostaea oceani]|uniref:shikimate dehydrogenase n=1 Tax=Miltoncostaea oceani TaxID=2843216 RepID=UPI001C3C47C7|nr:shikimate dehydrogenase [Miltoncostaea oceani]